MALLSMFQLVNLTSIQASSREWSITSQFCYFCFSLFFLFFVCVFVEGVFFCANVKLFIIIIVCLFVFIIFIVFSH